MESLIQMPLAFLAQSWFPYWGGLSIICAIIGYFISGVLGMILGLLLGPIGLLIALLVPKRTAV
ncbi:MAG: hypothetical protein M3R04_01265 [bacterium]|nr:hypothetical protein [bacterium]